MYTLYTPYIYSCDTCFNAPIFFRKWKSVSRSDSSTIARRRCGMKSNAAYPYEKEEDFQVFAFHLCCRTFLKLFGTSRIKAKRIYVCVTNASQCMRMVKGRNFYCNVVDLFFIETVKKKISWNFLNNFIR